MSIPDLQNKIKSTMGIDKNTIFVSLIIILVAGASFFLGRISATNRSSPGSDSVTILNQKGLLPGTAYTGYRVAQDKEQETTTTPGMYVASKNGKLYYTIGCKAANRLSEKTKIYFNSIGEAQKAGYTPAPSCK